MTVAAVVAVLLLAVIVVFQLALAFGAPLGYAAWGGQHPHVLPTRLRVASGVAAVVIYPVISLLILASADMIEADWLPIQGPAAMWALAGFLALGALANLASRSRIERLWGPVALVISVCCAVIAATMAA
jgi:hypothetical protein